MKQRKILMVSIIAVAVLSAGQITFAGAPPVEYNAPTGGTLVLSENYGSDADGQGSWVNIGTNNAITVNTDHILVGLKDWDGKKIGIWLDGILDIAADSYTIDMGWNLWRTDDVTNSAMRMVVASDTGESSGPKIIYSIDSTVANSEGLLWGEPGGNTLSVQQNTPQVIRMTGTPIDGPDYNPILANDSDDTSLATVYWGSTSDILALTSGGKPRWSVVEISWLRIYKDVMDDSAPLGGSTPTYLLGDANLDGVVSAGDYASVQSNFGSTGAVGGGLLGDANLDGVVSAGDYASVQANFGATLGGATVPEPATMGLLAIGALAVIHKRL